LAVLVIEQAKQCTKIACLQYINTILNKFVDPAAYDIVRYEK